MPDKTTTITPTMKIRDCLTVFDGWRTAYFPVGIDTLQTIFHEPYVTRDRLDQAALQVEGFPLKGLEDEPETSDGFDKVVWEVGYYFDLPRGGEMVVLIPKKDSMLFCAVYARGRGFSDMVMLGEIVTKLAVAIKG